MTNAAIGTLGCGPVSEVKGEELGRIAVERHRPQLQLLAMGSSAEARP